MNTEMKNSQAFIFAKLIKIHEVRENLVPKRFAFYNTDIFKEIFSDYLKFFTKDK